jgi:hypothetical protein
MIRRHLGLVFLAGFLTVFASGAEARHGYDPSATPSAQTTDGSTNWSASGQGTFVISGKGGGPGYKAQNNTQTIFTDPDSINRFQTELVAEHLIARRLTTPAPTAARGTKAPRQTRGQ